MKWELSVDLAKHMRFAYHRLPSKASLYVIIRNFGYLAALFNNRQISQFLHSKHSISSHKSVTYTNYIHQHDRSSFTTNRKHDRSSFTTDRIHGTKPCSTKPASSSEENDEPSSIKNIRGQAILSWGDREKGCRSFQEFSSASLKSATRDMYKMLYYFIIIYDFASIMMAQPFDQTSTFRNMLFYSVIVWNNSYRKPFGW
jgi:hypothetical protein